MKIKYLKYGRNSFGSSLLIILFLFLTPLNFYGQTKTLKESDWKLGLQAWTFKDYSFEETLQKMDSLGLRYVEAFPGQRISKVNKDEVGYDIGKEDIETIKNLLEKYDIEMVSMGIFGFEDVSKKELDSLFQFAHQMKLANIGMEPPMDMFPYISKLADKYQVKVAIHNHARPTQFWHTDSILKNIEKGNGRLGSAADIGHWKDSGLNVVECLNKLKGHIIELHLKDINKEAANYLPHGVDPANGDLNSRGVHDVPLGKGVINLPGVMKELKKQDFRGYMFIEHEYNFGHNFNDVKKSIIYFKQLRSALLED